MKEGLVPSADLVDKSVSVMADVRKMVIEPYKDLSELPVSVKIAALRAETGLLELEIALTRLSFFLRGSEEHGETL